MAAILAIDSSGDVFSAALGSGADVLVQSVSGQAHAACALPTIDALLNERGIALDDCAAFAFAAGPGKFSALRLVCSIARSFAYAHHKPLIAVPGFAALALANYGNVPLTVNCALPAYREHVYFGVCENSGARWQVKRSTIRHCDDTAKGAISHACGAGYQHYPQLLGNADYCPTAPYSNAQAVLQLAEEMMANDEISNPLSCEPFYLRRKVAQTIYERQCSRTS